jgi:hypothetical protein
VRKDLRVFKGRLVILDLKGLQVLMATMALKDLKVSKDQ